MFGTILSKIFGHEAQSSATSGAAPGAPAQTVAANTGAAASGSAPPAVASAPSPDTTGAASTAPSAAGASAASASAGSASGGRTVDVAQVLDGMPHHETLDWRHSIVDLMKLLNLDSSLSARKELAHELNYTGDTADSASMNMWLHKEVMRKLAANGGKLPADLSH